jgi:tRNA A-37 threonylcarbamoyl transferase component Bud32
MSEWIEAVVAGSRWRVRPEHRALLLGETGLRLSEWLRRGEAVVIKHAPHRTVYEVRLPGLHFYVKHNRLLDARGWLRARMRPGKALAEYERTLAIAARGVPTFVPLAAGEPLRGPGDSFLLTLALEATQQLNTFLEQVLPGLPLLRQTRLRQRIAVALGQLLADMHDAGIVHHDLHAGNLLLELAEDRPCLYLIDLHAVRLTARLGWRASRDNLVIINRWFVLRASRSDRLRFWRAYCTRRGTAGLCTTRMREVEELTTASNRAFWHGLEGRCLDNNRRFRRVRSAVASGHAVTDLDASALDALLADPDLPFRPAGARLLKDSRSTTIAEIDLPVNGTVRRVICKRFRITSGSDPWLALLRPTPALRSWRNGHSLRLRWLPTPRPLAVFQRRRHGLAHEGYLLTAKVEDAEDLHAFRARVCLLPAEQRRRAIREVIEHAARLVRDLHNRGVSHRDLKAANVLVVRDPAVRQEASAEPLDHWPLTTSRVWLIDLVGVRLHQRLGQRRKVQNLARLNASFLDDGVLQRTDKLRFLRLYLAWGLGGRAGWKGWWHEIDRATRAKVAQNARRGRPLS